MIRTFKAFSLLLSYPSAELQQAIPAIRTALNEEAVLSQAQIMALAPLLERLEIGDLYALCEEYVLLFDRSRTLSLNLFEHIHGESRDRGGAMVDLLETYRAGGFDLVGTELPDHLPVLLEFLATRSLAEAQALLADAGAILAALAERLKRREAPYAPVLANLVALAREGGETDTVEMAATLLAEADDDPEDLAALDAVWEEAQVSFAPDPDAGCPVTRDTVVRGEIPLTPMHRANTPVTPR